MLRSAMCSAAVALALLCAAPLPAHAINQTSGVIELSGTTATVDLWFFTINAGGPFETGVQLDPISVGPPLTNEDMTLRVYAVSGGNIGALLGSDGVSGGSASARVEFLGALALPSGDYVAVVTASDLAAGQFGPTHNAAIATPNINYELTLDLAGGNNSTYTCSITGNLDGTFTKSPAGAACVIPAASAVPAPASLGLLLAGIAGIAGLRAVRRG